MAPQKWRDPVMEEIRQTREKLDKEFEKDPKGLMRRAREKIAKAGFRLVGAKRTNKKNK